MAEASITTLTIPKGKKVLDFLQEQDGDSGRLQRAWVLLHSDVKDSLLAQLSEPHYDKELCTLYLFHEVGDYHVAKVSYAHRGISCWYMLHEIKCFDECPYKITFSGPCEFPSEVILIMRES